MTWSPTSPREEAQKALLEIFASANRLPIALFEQQNGQLVKIASRASLDDLDEPYCRAIREYPIGRLACEDDQCVRASEILQAGQGKLTLCHAGLYSQALPIKIDGQTRAVLLYGEMRIDDKEYEERSLQQHQAAVSRLNLSSQQAEQLQQLLDRTKRFSLDDLEVLKATLPKVGVWFYRLFDEEDRLKRHVEKTTHELQTRVQSLMANSEILYIDLCAVRSLKQELKEKSSSVLNSTLALSTIIRNLGESLQEHRFEKRPVAPLLYEAKRIYGAEAEKRGVEIIVHLDPVDGRSPVLEISQDDLQYAFNNLLHNAVKYSFRGSIGRERYVRVTGQPAGSFYCITFENFGVGILPEEIKNRWLFLDRYQGKLTQGEYRTGSGKGLYVTSRIIDRHHGQIDVFSYPKGDEEKGPEGQPHLNQFAVYLPYRQPEES